MASSLDSIIGSIQKDLNTAASKVVHQGVNDVLKGRKIDPVHSTNATTSVIDRAIGGMLNTSIQAVNSKIAKSLGKYTKRSPINVIAANYAADVLKSVITGRDMPKVSFQMTNIISRGISTELMAKLPKSLTKNLNVDILGTKFNVGLSPYISKAINDMVGGVISTMFSAPSSISGQVRIPTAGQQIPTPPSFQTDLGSLMGSISSSLGSTLDPNLLNSLSNTLSGLGSDIMNVLGSLKNTDLTGINGVVLPAGTDPSRFATSSDGLGKMIQLSSTPIGTCTGTPGLSKDEYSDIQKQLSASNINNPLLSLGGQFPDINTLISGGDTLSGSRSITKDLNNKYVDINSGYGVQSDQDKKAIESASKATIEIGKSVATKAVSDAKSFNSMSNDQLEKLTTIKTGFTDPNAKYPLPDYKGRSETNKLSTGHTDNTIVDKKNADRMMGAQLPNGASWDQPVSPYNAKYPYNHVTETESGHITEFDDTPGAERIHQYHKSGTFHEIDALGNLVTVIKGSNYTIIDSNGYISVNGKANISVNGECNVFIGANANIEVTGNAVVNSHNNIELNAAGRLKLTAGEGIDIKSPEIYVDADNQLQVNADLSTKIHTKEFNMIVDTDAKIDVLNDIRITSKGNTDIHVGKQTKLTSIEKIQISSNQDILHTTSQTYHVNAAVDIKNTSGGNTNILASGEFRSSSSGNTSIKAGGAILNKASGVFSADGSQVHLNSGQSSGAVHAEFASVSEIAKFAEALETEYSDTHYITGRKSIVENVIEDSHMKQHVASKVSGKLLSYVIANDTNISDMTKSELIEDYDISPAIINTKAVIIEKLADVQAPMPQVINPTELPLGDTVVPANFNLSPNFPISKITIDAVNSTPLVPVGKMMPLSKVIANMQYMALNVLEPIYAVRPDMIVDTGFLPPDKTGNAYSRNNYGLNVVLDFKNAMTFDDYCEIANIVRQIIPYDELVLWYLSKSFVNSHKDTALLVINLTGVFYPSITTVNDATAIDKWIKANSNRSVKTWYNATLVGDGLYKVS